MSENTSETDQRQQMEELFICDDIWYEVFAFLDPFELGLKMALINDRLDVLVDVHFKSRKWSMGWMEIRRAIRGNGAEIITKRLGEWLPIPQEPLPDKVIGFKGIWIDYVDQSVIEFLQRFRRLLDSSGPNVYIGTSINQSLSWDIIQQNVWPLVSDNICGLLSLDPSVLGRLRRFSPTILRNCATLRSIHCIQLFPQFPAEDNAAASSDKALAKWLITPRGDGLPKMLYCDFIQEGLKESFVNASEPANFIIRFLGNYRYFVPFELTNNWTGERLTFGHFNEDKWLLVRCPIEREEDKWTNWEKEAIEWQWYHQWNRIAIIFQDSGIGDGMDEANEGSSEPKKPKK